MGEGAKPFRSAADMQSEADRTVEKVKRDVEEWVEGFNLQEISSKVQDFGRKNPIALALAALTVGVAAGILVRKKL